MCSTFGKGRFLKLVPVASLIQVLVLVRVSYKDSFQGEEEGLRDFSKICCNCCKCSHFCVCNICVY